MEEELSPQEVLAEKHKKEKKNLRAQIQTLKKTVTKGDKKKQKEVHAEILKLEDELNKKHAEELKALDNGTEEVTESLADMEIEEEIGPKVTKAQKRRQKKDQLNRELQRRIAEQEIENENGLRNTEMKKICEKLEQLGLSVFEIPSDGDCLYKAVDHGLQKVGVPLGIQALREKVSRHMLSNPEKYQPFLTDDQGKTMSEEKFQEYCEKIANTKQWGGNHEVVALASVLERTILVIQGDGPDLEFGNFKANGVIVITYHRHMYRLGEHYNSVQPCVAQDDF